MSAPHANSLLGPRATIDAALRAIDVSRDAARGVLEAVIALARQDAALSLRLAMVLAWVKRQDLAGLGYPSFAAFCREQVGWADSWLRDLVRLVESPLDLVKAAAARDLVPLRVAVKAPGRVRVEDQAEWLLEPVIEAAPRRGLEAFTGDDAAVVRQSRRLARLCIGRPVSDAEVDAYVLSAWRERVPAEALLAAARERPEKPEWGALSWGWADEAPARELLGPWEEPASLDAAVEAVRAIEALRAGRAAVLARGWAMTGYHALWTLTDCTSEAEFAREVLGWSPRTAQRQKRLGWALEWYPELDAAIAQGLDPGAAGRLVDVVDRPTVARWVAVAHRVGRLELARAAAEARCDRATLGRYERAIAAADSWVAAGALLAGGPANGFVGAEPTPGSLPTADTGDPRSATTGGPAAPCAGGLQGAAPSAGGLQGVAPSAGGLPGAPSGGGPADAPSAGGPLAPSAGGPIRVALPHGEEPPSEAIVRGPRDLPEAARWFVEHLRIEPQRGFGKVKERDGWRCQNPECGRASLRAEAHHIHPRSLGGSDDLENGVTVCRVCHLRGLHANGGLMVDRVVVGGVEALWWRYPGGRSVLQFRGVPGS